MRLGDGLLKHLLGKPPPDINQVGAAGDRPLDDFFRLLNRQRFILPTSFASICDQAWLHRAQQALHDHKESGTENASSRDRVSTNPVKRTATADVESRCNAVAEQ